MFVSHACCLLNNDIMSCSSIILHYKEISIQLGINHDRCYLSKKRNDNFSLDLNIDDNCIDLKKMHCIDKGI